MRTSASQWPRSGAFAPAVITALTVFLTLPAVALAGPKVPRASHEAREAVRAGFAIGVGLELLFIAIVAITTPRIRTMVIGKDNRVSTSKTIAAAWTLVVAAGLFAVVYASWLDHPQAINYMDANGIVGQYAVLFGGPIGAAILAKGIVTRQVDQNPSLKQPGGSPSPADLIADDKGNTDLGDLQYVLFNTVAVAFVIGTLLNHPMLGLPHIPDVLLGLTSVSAVGYVGKKALTPTDVATAECAPGEGPVDTPVRVTITGLRPASQPDARAWLRFGSEDGAIVPAPVNDGITVIERNAPRLAPAPAAPVPVAVVLADGSVLDAGTYRYS